MSNKKRRKTLVQAEKELKLAMQKVIEKYKALKSSDLCKCKQNKVYSEYFCSDKKTEDKSYSEKIGVLIIDRAEDIIDCFDEVDRHSDDDPTFAFLFPIKNLDDNTELKAWYKKE